MAAWTGLVWNHKHNVQGAPILERLAWLTDVISKRSGAEQRRALRSGARRSLEYKVTPLNAVERATLENFIHKALSDMEPVLFPIWTDSERLTAQLSAGASSIPLSTATKDYDAGGYVILRRAVDDYEVIEIDSITGSAINLAVNTAETWPAGAVIAPARPGYFRPLVPGSRFSRDGKHITVGFEILPSSVSSNRFASVSLTQYRSRDVLLDRPEVSEDRNEAFEREAARVDFETGVFGYDGGGMNAPFQTHDYRRKLRTRAEIADFLGFLALRRGRLSPFWAPSWGADFDVTAGGGSLTFRECGYAANVNAAEGRRDVSLSYADGTTRLRRLSAPVNNGDGTETATLNLSATGTGLQLASYLRFCRLEADAVELAWETTGFAKCALRFRELIKTA